MTQEADDKDVLAAEFALGTLDADDRANVQMQVALDPAFAATVASWERRLGELNELVEPVEPPADTWEKVKSRVAGVEPSAQMWLPGMNDMPPLATSAAAAGVPSNPPMPDLRPPSAEVIVLSRRVRKWRGMTAVVGSLAAALTALVVTREIRPDLLPAPLRPREIIKEVAAPKMAEFVAVFQKDDASPAFLLTVDVDKRVLSVRKVGAEQQAGKSYELWILPASATVPRSLGLVGDQEFTVRRALADYDAPTLNNATFGISLEPAGGSPTGKPTGPVFHSKLLQTTPPAFPQASP
jgi:anti-sigma-K factor RskA